MMMTTRVDQIRNTEGTMTTRRDLVQGKMGISLEISPSVRLVRNTTLGGADLTQNPNLSRDLVGFANPRNIKP